MPCLISPSGKTLQLIASAKVLAIFCVGLLPLVSSHLALAENSVSAGVAVGDELVPFLALKSELDWKASQWNQKSTLEGRIERDDGIGDANFAPTWHGDTLLSPTTKFELDASYAFDRERAESIKQFHVLGGDVGLEQKFNDFVLKTDAGLEASIYQNTKQSGFPSLDRSREDHFNSEISARLTYTNNTNFHPFAELAYFDRDYFINTNRDFHGPELIIGATLANQSITGDIGVFMGARKSDRGENETVIGPYLDLSTTRGKTTITFAASAGIEQDTSGSRDLYPFYSTRLEIAQKLRDDLTLSLVVDGVIEDRVPNRETEIIPLAKLEWAQAKGLGLYGTAGFTYTKIEGQASSTDPSFEIGVKWHF